MSGENSITVTGNLTADPELRNTPSGTAVANFTIASTPRAFDRQAGGYKDGDTLFLRASVWREAAEYAAETLTKGTRVIAQGRLKPRSYETKTGEKRTILELEIDEIGVSLKFGPVTVHHAQRASNHGAAESAGEPAGVHPVDLLPISAREYADDDAWFGKIANPEGRGVPAPAENGHAPAEEPVFKGLALPPGMLTGNVPTPGPTTPGAPGNVN
ncbi:single-stranded DNA-binding protein [Arthrobacter crystallopoietes]|uniref:single-stranded DNA-binding protein n=1 Tax=Crystallibacter crystallopoietes TaxID=37928 RepID=UPI0011114364|nr:single-stranded DNA-binding protein [Arthrobacter crystallopoietes]